MKISKVALAVVSSLAVLLVPRFAQVSHVTQEVELRAVVEQAQWICAAEYLGPDPDNPAVHRFRAVETLIDQLNAKPAPGEFRVVTPWAVANAMAKQAFQATGVRRFPLIQRMAHGAEFPGQEGGRLLLFLKEHDRKVFLLVAEGAALDVGQRDRVLELIVARGRKPSGEATADLVFRGEVESIEISPLPGSPNNFVVTTRVLEVVAGSFSGSHFSFRIHSPSKSRIALGQQLEVRAQRVPAGYRVDPGQFLGRR
jgi:hypothetical protein